MSQPPALDSAAGHRGVLVNADTGEPIRWARRADLRTGEYEAFRMDPDLAVRQGIPLASILYRGRARLRFVASGALVAPSPYRPAPAAPLEELRAEVLKGRVVTPVIVLPGAPAPECEGPGCRRPAAWQTADAREVEPDVAPDGRRCARAVATAYHVWCDRCYRAPVKTSLRGVEAEADVGAARPQ